MRALGWAQFLADCASVVALFLLLGDADPTQYRALAVGYVLTTGAQLVAAATLAYNYYTEVRVRSRRLQLPPLDCGCGSKHSDYCVSWWYQVREAMGSRRLVDKMVAGIQCSICTALTLGATLLLFVLTPLNLFFDAGISL